MKKLISYSTEQVAEMMQLEQETIRQFIRLGKLGAYKAGKEWRVTEKDLYEYVESNRLKKVVG